MTEFLISILSITCGIFSWLFAITIYDLCVDRKIPLKNGIKYLAEDLYTNRNLFGIICSSFVILLTIPSWIVILIIISIMKIIKFIWELGNKKG